jgi:hypothetical protein
MSIATKFSVVEHVLHQAKVAQVPPYQIDHKLTHIAFL